METMLIAAVGAALAWLVSHTTPDVPLESVRVPSDDAEWDRMIAAEFDS